MIILGVLAFLIMGLTLGLIGGGGSILTVPILVYIFKQDPQLATASSLFIVGATAAVGGLQYTFRKEVDLKIVLLFSIPSFIGVYVVRKIVLPAIPEVISLTSNLSFSKSFLVMVSFALIMLIASYKMIQKNEIRAIDKLQQKLTFKTILKIILNALMIGAIAGFVGAGGGFLIIPALAILLNIPIRTAVGSSLLIIAIQSLLGFLFSSHLALIDWNFLFLQIGIAVIGIFAGSYLNKFVPEKKLKVGFGYFVLIVSLLILTEQLVSKSI